MTPEKPPIDALATLGTLIDSTAKRDAVHIAVYPAQAAQELWPGHHVGKVEGGFGTASTKYLGIVDPFLKAVVPKGAWFWLFVYPRQTTLLRHAWNAEGFEDETEETPKPVAPLLADEFDEPERCPCN